MIQTKLYASFVLFFFAYFTTIAQNFAISGYISDSETKEKLIGVTIFDSISQKGTVTNQYGYYSLSLPKGNYDLSIAYLGYESIYVKIELEENVKRNFFLKPTELPQRFRPSR